MKNFFLVIKKLIVLLLFQSCSSNKICYDYYLCRDKLGISVEVKGIDTDSTLIIINNLRTKKIIVSDSLEVIFYKYNQNLKSPHHDSVDNKSKRIIEYVPQNAPVILAKVYFDLPVFISRDSPYTLSIAKSTIFNHVKEFGNLDNQFQLRNGFQVFVKSSYKHAKILVASKIFTLNN